MFHDSTTATWALYQRSGDGACQTESAGCDPTWGGLDLLQRQRRLGRKAGLFRDHDAAIFKPALHCCIGSSGQSTATGEGVVNIGKDATHVLTLGAGKMR